MTAPSDMDVKTPTQQSGDITDQNVIIQPDASKENGLSTTEEQKQDEPTLSAEPNVLEAGDGEAITQVVSGPPYTVFSRSMKIWLSFMFSFGSFISPVTANIYFPALSPIAQDLGVSQSLINLTLTTYMIFQGLAPTFFGDFGDKAGRRPAYILAFSIYLLANIGLALQSNYAALMVLRCLQSAGSSGTIALGYAAVADIATTAERGKYMGYLGAGITVGPALGPVIGGLLTQYIGWQALFWFLAILVTVWLVPWILFSPETCRHVVGNGSIPAQSWNRPLVELLKRRKSQPQEAARSQRLRFPNPLKTLVLLSEKETALALFLNSILYVAFALVAATLATLFKEAYNYNDLQAGLCYLPYGLGCWIGVVGQGTLLDRNYVRIAKKRGFKIDRKRGDDLGDFPIELARIQVMYTQLTLGVGVLIAYGWTLHFKTTVAGPLVLLFWTGLFVPTAFNIVNTLIVDLHPKAPATATAANNLVRCFMGAGATAIVQFVLDGVGTGWTFTILGFLVGATLPGFILIAKKGPKWRRQQREKAERKKQQST